MLRKAGQSPRRTYSVSWVYLLGTGLGRMACRRLQRAWAEKRSAPSASASWRSLKAISGLGRDTRPLQAADGSKTTRRRRLPPSAPSLSRREWNWYSTTSLSSRLDKSGTEESGDVSAVDFDSKSQDAENSKTLLALARKGQLTEVLKELERKRRDKEMITPRDAHALLLCVGQLENSVLLFDTLREVEASDASLDGENFRYVIVSCLRSGHVDEAMSLLDTLLEKNLATEPVMELILRASVTKVDKRRLMDIHGYMLARGFTPSAKVEEQMISVLASKKAWKEIGVLLRGGNKCVDALGPTAGNVRELKTIESHGEGQCSSPLRSNANPTIAGDVVQNACSAPLQGVTNDTGPGGATPDELSVEVGGRPSRPLSHPGLFNAALREFLKRRGADGPRLCLETARRMRELGVEPNAQTYFILGHMFADLDMVDRLNLCLREVSQLQETLPQSMVVAVLDCYRRVGDYDNAQQIWEIFRRQRPRESFVNQKVYAAVINVYSEAEDYGRLKELHEELRSRDRTDSLTVYNALLYAYARANDATNLVRTLEEILQAGIEPDGATKSILLTYFKDCGQLEDCYRLFRYYFPPLDGVKVEVEAQMRTPLTTDSRSLNRSSKDTTTGGFLSDVGEGAPVSMKSKITADTLIQVHASYDPRSRDGGSSSAYHKVTEESESVVRSSGSRGQSKSESGSLTAFTTVLDALGKAGQEQRALAILKEMRNRGITPDESTYKAVLYMLLENDDVDTSLRLKRQLKGQFRPDIRYYQKVLHKICRRKTDLDSNLRWLEEEMECDGVQPDLIFFSRLIKEFSTRQDPTPMERALDKMRAMNLQVDETIRDLAVERYLLDGRVAAAVNILYEGCYVEDPDGKLYLSLLSACGKWRDRENAARVLQYMRDHQAHPTAACYHALCFQRGEQPAEARFDDGREVRSPYRSNRVAASQLNDGYDSSRLRGSESNAEGCASHDAAGHQGMSTNYDERDSPPWRKQVQGWETHVDSSDDTGSKEDLEADSHESYTIYNKQWIRQFLHEMARDHVRYEDVAFYSIKGQHR